MTEQVTVPAPPQTSAGRWRWQEVDAHPRQLDASLKAAVILDDTSSATRVELRLIDGFEDDRYELILPMLIRVCLDPDGGWVACMVGSSICMPGDSRADAIKALEDDILDAYDIYSQDDNLGPGPLSEWSALQRYVQRRHT